MQPTSKALLVAWVTMLQLAVAMPLADLGTVRGSEGSATNAGHHQPGVNDSVDKYSPRDVAQSAVEIYEPAAVRSFQADGATIEARFALAHDGQHWIVIPPVARSIDSEPTRYEQVGRDLVADEESLALRHVARSENAALVGRAFSKLQCFTAIMTLSWGNDDGCSKNPKKATKLKISEVSTKRDVPEPDPEPEERALVEHQEETGLVPMLKRGYSNLACFTWIMTMSLGNDAGCSKNAKKATKLKITEVSTKRDLLAVPQDDAALVSARAVVAEDNMTSEFGRRAESVDERDVGTETEKPYRDQCVYNKPWDKRDNELYRSAQRSYQERDVVKAESQQTLTKRRSFIDYLNKGANCFLAYGLALGTVPIYKEGCKNSKRDVTVIQNLAGGHISKRDKTTEMSELPKRGVGDKIHQWTMCGVAYGVLFGQIKEVTDVCKGKNKRDLTAVETTDEEKRNLPEALSRLRFGEEKTVAERPDEVETRKRGVAGCIMFITTQMGDWNSCRSRSSRRKKAFKKPFKKAYDHIKYLY